MPLVVFSFFSFMTHAFSGFGAIIIPVALGAHFYSIKWILPVLIPLALVSNIYIFFRHGKYIDRKVLFNKILPVMLVGFIIGIIIFTKIHSDILKRLFGILIVILSARELYSTRKRDIQQKTISMFQSILFFFSAGIVQGVYASGGPLLVYVLNKMNLPKSVFRSTLSSVWLLTSFMLVISYLITNQINQETLKASLFLIPSLVLGLTVGELLHRRVSDRPFKFWVFCVLVVSGVSIVFR